MNRSTKSDVDKQTRKTSQYRQGKRAFLSSRDVDECPYRKGENRVRWMCGWYDERTRKNLGHIFKKWNLSWP